MCECVTDPSYVCYCSQVTETMIADAIRHSGAQSVEDVIRITGVMRHCNCAVNNPKGVCCYSDIVSVCAKYHVTRIR